MSESGNCASLRDAHASFQFHCFHFYRVTVVRRSYLRAQLLKFNNKTSKILTMFFIANGEVDDDLC